MNRDLFKSLNSALLFNRPICFRVTRACNAKCSFCLAPPDGLSVSLDTLKKRMLFLRNLGFTMIDICGGEPTLRKDLSQIVQFAKEIRLQSSMTTNGIRISDDALSSLTGINVKISVHGAQESHDQIVGIRGAFDRLSENIQRLKNNNSNVICQSVVSAGRKNDTDNVVDFCIKNEIKELRLATFVSRGDGIKIADKMTLDKNEIVDIQKSVYDKAKNSRLKVRWLKFDKPLLVAETNGKLVLEHPNEKDDLVVLENLHEADDE